MCEELKVAALLTSQASYSSPLPISAEVADTCLCSPLEVRVSSVGSKLTLEVGMAMVFEHWKIAWPQTSRDNCKSSNTRPSNYTNFN